MMRLEAVLNGAEVREDLAIAALASRVETFRDALQSTEPRTMPVEWLEVEGESNERGWRVEDVTNGQIASTAQQSANALTARSVPWAAGVIVVNADIECVLKGFAADAFTVLFGHEIVPSLLVDLECQQQVVEPPLLGSAHVDARWPARIAERLGIVLALATLTAEAALLCLGSIELIGRLQILACAATLLRDNADSVGLASLVTAVFARCMVMMRTAICARTEAANIFQNFAFAATNLSSNISHVELLASSAKAPACSRRCGALSFVDILANERGWCR